MPFLDKIFKKGFRASATQAQTAEHEIPLSEDIITDQYAPLWELKKQRQLLEAKITGSSRAYQSMILAIDTERGLLWLDDLFPQQHLLDVGDEITVRHHRNGEQLMIRAEVVAMGSTYHAYGFAIPLPGFVYYMPRRSSP